jgi:hypothetical protein
MFFPFTPLQLLAVVLSQVDATHDEQMRMTLIGVKVRRRRHKNTEDRVLMLNPSAEVCGTRVMHVSYCFDFLSGCFDCVVVLTSSTVLHVSSVLNSFTVVNSSSVLTCVTILTSSTVLT